MKVRQWVIHPDWWLTCVLYIAHMSRSIEVKRLLVWVRPWTTDLTTQVELIRNQRAYNDLYCFGLWSLIKLIMISTLVIQLVHYFIISGFKWDILKSRNISNVFAESEFPCESAESVNALFKAHCSHSKYFPLIFKDFESE